MTRNVALSAARAYPRVRGGTVVTKRTHVDIPGLSPRPRGNLREHQPRDLRRGPIPASAGEPSLHRAPASPLRAYPRVRGGTGSCCLLDGVDAGLSPRPRGNLRKGADRRSARRPIPASAGEPGRRRFVSTITRAYPRVRGGTPVTSYYGKSNAGLSPRPRGNPSLIGAADFCDEPIPASAGEPRHRRGDLRASRAYPRVRGGTPSVIVAGGDGGSLSPRPRGNPP